VSELFEKRSSKIIVYLFIVYMIILSLLTFTDMANIFANSIGLRNAFVTGAAGVREVTPNRLRAVIEGNPRNLGSYHFEPNLGRYFLYTFIGLVIVFLIDKIENKGDSISNKTMTKNKILRK